METETKVKPHGTFKISQGGNANIPSLIRKEIGAEEIAFIVDAKTALLFPPQASTEDILKSLELIKSSISLREIKAQ